MNFLEAISKTVLNEGLNPEFSAGFSGIDPDEHLYRQLGQTKDMDDYKLSRVYSICRWFAKTHPLCKRIVELTKDFVIGSGISYEAENPKVKAALDSFWFNSLNNMGINHRTKINQLTIFGEQSYPVVVNPSNGDVTLGYVSPQSIDDIITSEDNILDIRQVKVKARAGEQPKFYNIIRLNEDTGFLEGDIFHFRINNLDDEKRGYSDLLSILDWLDVFDSILMGEADRIRLINSFVWDITLNNMSDEQIKDWLKTNGKPPKPGSIRAHNENASWEAVTPSLNTSDSTNYLKFLLSFMLGGVGLPEHYFALAYDINRATAKEMDDPLVKRIQDRQEIIRYMFGSIFDFVIDQAIVHGKQLVDRDTGKGLGVLREKEDLAYKLILPDPSKKDLIDMAQSLQPFANALAAAETKQWISKKTSSRVFINTLNQSGQEIDLDEEQKMIDEEKEENENNIYNRFPFNQQQPDANNRTDEKGNPIPGNGQPPNQAVK